MPAKMRTGIAAYMTRRPMPELLRWPSPMRNEPRSGLGEFIGVAISAPAPNDGKMLNLRSYARTKPKISHPANAIPRKTIVACKVKFRCFLLGAPLAIHFGCFRQVFGHQVFGEKEGASFWQNHCLTERPVSHIKGFCETHPTILFADGGPRMNPTRRDFLKLTTIGGAAAAVFGFDLKPAYAQFRTLKTRRA